MKQARETLGQLSEFLGRVEIAQSRNRLLREEVVQLREQLTAGVEAMGLGLTAEALSHEMFTIADGLATRTQGIAGQLSDGGADERELRQFVEYVRGTVGSLRKELAHFSPSLRYVRERREQLDMAVMATDIADYYRARWEGSEIGIALRDESAMPFLVRGSRGKLTQVFDNLLLNSEYWLEVALSQGRLERGRVNVRLHRPLVTVSDNGPGIEQSVEGSLFDPFVTRKPRGKGRGLGLFIVRQLLEADGCSIDLGPKRNPDGRHYQFVINLAGVLDDA
jgi:signal transduction histidine kinase